MPNLAPLNQQSDFPLRVTKEVVSSGNVLLESRPVDTSNTILGCLIVGLDESANNWDRVD